ncbi:DUF445 family protein [Bacillus licheniformis]|nr:DUF445 family protein [Bacillus licheniformis]
MKEHVCIWNFAVMIAVGALIGAVTNHLRLNAFRPYKAIYIFGKRVPFTPGLIPKRRDELARQMGQMVTGHLLTTEGLKKGLHPMRSKPGGAGWREALARLSQSTATVEEALESIGISNPAQKRIERYPDWRMRSCPHFRGV